MIDNEHEALVVDIPEGVEVVDPVLGWFKAEVQLLRCGDCGEYSVGWRRISSPANDQDQHLGKQE